MQDTPKATRVLIVDDHPVVVSGCRSLFASDKSVKIEEAADAKSGHRVFTQKRPDVTVIDIKLPDVSGFELMRRIRKDDPDAKIIMFSMNDDPAFVVRAVEMGAQGYVSKGDDPRLFVKAVRKVAAGENFISPHLAEAVAFSTAPRSRPDPATQMNRRASWKSCGCWRGETRSSRSPPRSTFPTRRWPIPPRCSSRSSAPRPTPISSVSRSRWSWASARMIHPEKACDAGCEAVFPRDKRWRLRGDHAPNKKLRELN